VAPPGSTAGGLGRVRQAGRAGSARTSPRLRGCGTGLTALPGDLVRARPDAPSAYV